MSNYRLGKSINRLCSEMPEVSASTKEAILFYANANRFSRAGGLPIFRIALGGALAVLVLGGGTVAVSQAAMPGHTLYPVKLVSEKIYSQTQLTSSGKTQVADAVLSRRADEAETMAGESDETSEEFANALAASSDDWVNAQDSLFSLAVAKDQ
jgi:hypothetical protein